jgi:gluconolactonase
MGWSEATGVSVTGGRQEIEQPPALYRFDPATGEIRVVAGPSRPTSGASTNQSKPDPRQYIRIFDVAADGVTLTRGGVFHKVEPGYADGFRVDEDT